MELPRRFPYNPRWRIIVFCALFFGACAVVMGYVAMHNAEGLMVLGLFRVGPSGATAFCWVVSALGAGFVLLAFLLAVRRVVRPQVFELGTDAMVLPHGLFQWKTFRIAYADMYRVWEDEVSNQTFLYLTAGGRRYTIAAALFPDDDSYQAVRSFLESQLRRSSPPPLPPAPVTPAP